MSFGLVLVTYLTHELVLYSIQCDGIITQLMAVAQ